MEGLEVLHDVFNLSAINFTQNRGCERQVLPHVQQGTVALVKLMKWEYAENFGIRGLALQRHCMTGRSNDFIVKKYGG